MKEEPRNTPIHDDPDVDKWCVAYTKPRAEKKLSKYCNECGIKNILPTYKSVKKYLRKTLVFEKPYFPGYVFIHTKVKNQSQIKKSSYLVKILRVQEQKLFQEQLDGVLKAIESGLDLFPVRSLKKGVHVRIKRGPLQGVEGIVEKCETISKIYLMLDFIGQGVETEVNGDDLEVID